MTLVGRALAVVLCVGFSGPALAETIHGTLYKDPHCACCEAHADYLRKNGFDLKIESVNNLAAMSMAAGVPSGSKAVTSSRSTAMSSKGTLPATSSSGFSPKGRAA